MAQTIGQILQDKRLERGLSIADVAHDTRIHSDTIRGLEADDYSVFASTTYARSFLLLYSRHLEVDADEALHDFASVAQQLTKSGSVALAPSASSSIEVGESIQAHKITRQSPAYPEHRKPAAPLFLLAAVLFLLLIIPSFYFIGKKANSLEEASAILKQAIDSTEEGKSEHQEETLNKENKTPLPGKTSTDSREPAATDESPPLQAKHAPSLVDQELSRHRFPRPLSEKKLPRTPSNTSSALPLKAIPITPTNPTPSKPDRLAKPD